MHALEFSECYDGKCLNGGKCVHSTGLCTCKKLFSGDRCEVFGKHFVDFFCVRGGFCDFHINFI